MQSFKSATQLFVQNKIACSCINLQLASLEMDWLTLLNVNIFIFYFVDFVKKKCNATCTQGNLVLILFELNGIKLYLPLSDGSGSKQTLFPFGFKSIKKWYVQSESKLEILVLNQKLIAIGAHFWLINQKLPCRKYLKRDCENREFESRKFWKQGVWKHIILKTWSLKTENFENMEFENRKFWKHGVWKQDILKTCSLKTGNFENRELEKRKFWKHGVWKQKILKTWGLKTGNF